MRKDVTSTISHFDFNPIEKVYLNKHVYSQYHEHIGKAAFQLRDMFEMIGMNPAMAVGMQAASVVGKGVTDDGLGEQFVVSFASDIADLSIVSEELHPAPMLGAGVQQCHGAIDLEEENVAYMSKDAVLAVFDQFVQEHSGKDFVSKDGASKLQFVSLAHKLRIFIQLLDDRVCQLVGSVDRDPNESAFNLTLDYLNPEGMITVNLYTP